MSSSTGVRDSNSTEKRVIKGLIQNEAQFIQSLRVFANSSTLSGLGATGGDSNNSPNNPSGNYFAKSGDIFLGQKGNAFEIVTIANGQLNIAKEIGSTSPILVVNPEGGTSDFLDKLFQGTDVFPYQEQLLQFVSQNITIRPKLLLTITNIVGTGVDNIITVTVASTAALATGDKIDISNTTNFNIGDVEITVTGGTTFTYDLGSIGSATSESSGDIDRGNFKLPDDAEFVATPNTIVHAIFNTVTQLWDFGTEIFSSGESGANIELSNLGITDVNADINMKDNSLTFTSADTSFISADSTAMFFDVPSGDGFKFRINNIETLEILANGDIQINGKDIFGIVDLSFEITGIDIESDTGGLTYQVPSGDTHSFEVNLSEILQISSSAVTINQDIELGGNELQLNTSNTSSISADNTNMFFDVPASDGFTFRINNVEAIRILANGQLDVSDENIVNIADLSFSISGQDIESSASGLTYQVPSGDSHIWEINNTQVLNLSSSQLILGSNVNTFNLQTADLTNVDDIGFAEGHDLFSSSVGLEFQTASTGDRIDFDIGGSNLVFRILNAQIDVFQDIDFNSNSVPDFSVTSSFANSGSATLPSNPDGFWQCKINGVSKLVPFYNG